MFLLTTVTVSFFFTSSNDNLFVLLQANAFKLFKKWTIGWKIQNANLNIGHQSWRQITQILSNTRWHRQNPVSSNRVQMPRKPIFLSQQKLNLLHLICQSVITKRDILQEVINDLRRNTVYINFETCLSNKYSEKFSDNKKTFQGLSLWIEIKNSKNLG